MKNVIIPPSPGVTSAYGLLLTDVRIDLVHTDVQREDRLDHERVTKELGLLEKRVTDRLEAEGFEGDGIQLQHFVDMRYGGQAYEIRVPLEHSRAGLEKEALGKSLADFHASHKDLYGYSYEGIELVELVNVGVTGFGLLSRPQIPALESVDASPRSALKEQVDVFFPQTGGTMECPVYYRSKLRAGSEISGPAIVEQYDSTTVVNPDWEGRVDKWGSLILSKVGI